MTKEYRKEQIVPQQNLVLVLTELYRKVYHCLKNPRIFRYGDCQKCLTPTSCLDSCQE